MNEKTSPDQLDKGNKKRRFRFPFFRQQTKVEAVKESPPHWREEHLKALRRSTSSNTEMSRIYFALVQNADWKNRFETSLKGHYSLEEQLEFLFNADALQQLDHSTILTMLPHLLQNEKNRVAAEPAPDRNLEQALQSVISRMEQQPNFTEEWYTSLAQALLDAKTSLLEAIPSSAQHMQQLFGETSPKPLSNAVLVLSPMEYEEAIKALRGNNQAAIEHSQISNGMTVKSRTALGEDGIVVKVTWQLKLTNNENPQEGLRANAALARARSTLNHEMIHYQPRKVIDEVGPEKTRMHGFTRSRFGETGEILTGDFPDELPRTAFEEGVVVLLQHVVENNFSLDLAIQALQAHSAAHDSRYRDAALIIADLVSFSSLEQLKAQYSHSDLNGWLEYLKNEMGEAKVQSSIEALRKVGLYR